MLSLLMLAAQTNPVVSVPSTREAPPVIVSSHPPDRLSFPRSAMTQEVQPVLIEVDARGEDGPIWSGTLLVGNQQSVYRVTKSEPFPLPCQQGPDYSGRAPGFSITLNRSTYRPQGAQLRVAVEWSRNDVSACPGAASVRKTSIDATVMFDPAGTITLRGDGGLVIRLRPR